MDTKSIILKQELQYKKITLSKSKQLLDLLRDDGTVGVLWKISDEEAQQKYASVIEKVDVLIKTGANINYFNPTILNSKYNTTPLSLAINRYGHSYNKSFDIVNFLIENGANVNQIVSDKTDRNRYTALGEAVLIGGNLDLVKLLLDNGANTVNVIAYNNKWKNMHEVAEDHLKLLNSIHSDRDNKYLNFKNELDKLLVN